MEGASGKKQVFAEKLAAIAGIGTIAISPGTASSDVVILHDAPMPITAFAHNALVDGIASDTLSWDIDGHLLGLFQFDITGSSSFCVRLYCAEYVTARVAFYGYGGEFIAVAGKLKPLPESYSLGPSHSNYDWGLGRVPILNLRQEKWTEFHSTYPGGDRVPNPPWYATKTSLDAAFSELQDGENFVGVRFNNYHEPGAPQHYGFANFELTNGALTIKSLAYDDEPETPVHVQAIPAPSAGVAALTLLGMGAAGLRRMRKVKQQTRG